MASILILDERFARETLDSRLRWMNPPEGWSLSGGVLSIEPRAGTDFWRRPLTGIEADNGHILGMDVEGDFVVTTEVRYHFVHQYDQAGLMVRAAPDCWVKTSVEHQPGGPGTLGAVVTNLGHSDWSLQDYRGAGALRLRIEYRGGDVTVEFAGGADGWHTMREAHLHRQGAGPLLCGLYACSPKGEGFRAEFTGLRIETAG